MSDWLDWGIPIILYLQSLGDLFIDLMGLFTFLGTEYFYLLVLPILLWNLDPRLGLRLGFLLLSSGALNAILKVLFGLPRPYWVSRQIEAFASESSYGLPSGHAQNAVALWGGIALILRRRLLLVLALGLILLITVSRPALGVHYPLDSLAGLVVGLMFLVGYWLLEPRWLPKIKGMGLPAQIGLSFLASLGILLLGIIVLQLTASQSIPPAWVAAARLARPSSEVIDPRSVDPLISSTGTLVGLLSGGALLMNWGRFHTSVPFIQHLIRYFLGTVGVLVLFFGLRAILPNGDSLAAGTARFLRYGLVGLWVSFGAPWCFVRLGLSEGGRAGSSLRDSRA